MAKKKLTPLEKRNPAKRFVPMPYADAQRLLSKHGPQRMLPVAGAAQGGEVVAVEVEALRERNAILANPRGRKRHLPAVRVAAPDGAVPRRPSMRRTPRSASCSMARM